MNELLKLLQNHGGSLTYLVFPHGNGLYDVYIDCLNKSYISRKKKIDNKYLDDMAKRLREFKKYEAFMIMQMDEKNVARRTKKTSNGNKA